MADSVAVDVQQSNVPNGRSLYNMINANDLDGIRLLLTPLTLRHRHVIVCKTICRNNNTLLGHACELGFRDIAKYFLDECEADISDRFSRQQKKLTPLFVSVDKANVSVLLLLISRGAVVVDRREARNCSMYAFNKRYLTLSSILQYCTNRIRPLDEIAEFANKFTWTTETHFDNANVFFDFYSIFSASILGDISIINDALSAGMSLKITNDSEDNILCMTLLHEQRNAEHYLLNYRIFSVKDHLRALELCGAKFIVFLSDIGKGLRCWRRAIRIRTDEFFGVSDKFQHECKTILGSEFSCEEQLNGLATRGSELYIQALIVFVRLLCPYKELIKDAFVLVAQHPLFRNDLLRAIMVLSELVEFPINPLRESDYPLRRATVSLHCLFRRHFYSDPSDMGDFLLKFKYLINFIKEVNWKELLRDEDAFYLLLYLDLLLLVLRNINAMKKFNLCTQDEKCIKEGIGSILRFHSYPYPTTLLHQAINESPNFAMIPFLLSCSVDANCTDKEKNTPMHMIPLLSGDRSHLVYLVDLLADAGAHIDSVNMHNQTPLKWLEDIGIITNPLKFVSLQCMAAHAIHKYGIKIPEVFPKILVSFIKLHSD